MSGGPAFMFPMAPLMEYIRCAEFGREPGSCPQAEQQIETPVGILARLAGVGSEGVGRQVHRGSVTWQTADRYAVAVHLHPSAIWGDLWWDAITLTDDDRLTKGT